MSLLRSVLFKGLLVFVHALNSVIISFNISILVSSCKNSSIIFVIRIHISSLVICEYLNCSLLCFFLIISNIFKLATIFFLSPLIKYVLIFSTICVVSFVSILSPLIVLMCLNISTLVYFSL